MICPGCLNEKNIEEGCYCGSCRRVLFNGRSVPSVLSFSMNEYINFRAATKGKFSISGVQPKILLSLAGKELKAVIAGGTHILKPSPDRNNLPKFKDDVPANEHLTMQIASQIFRITTAKNCFIRFRSGEGAYLTKRFDRDGSGKGIPQEDFCQLMNISEETDGSDYKYKFSYESAAGVTGRFCAAKMIETEKLFLLILFNYVFSNGDAHLKNFSLTQSVHGDYLLAPAYDLLCTSLHYPDETRTALPLFDEIETPQYLDNGFHTGACFLKFAQVLKVRNTLAQKALNSYYEKESAVTDMVNRSMLSLSAKTEYLRKFKDRLNAIRIR